MMTRHAAARCAAVSVCLLLAGPAALRAQTTGETGGGGELSDALRAHASTWEQMVRLEDARYVDAAQRDTLRQLLDSPSAAIRALAVRGAGRAENVALLPLIRPLLQDPANTVRQAAAQAVAQTFHGAATPGATELARARDDLFALAERHGEDAATAAVAAEALARITRDTAGAARTAALLLPSLDSADARAIALRGLHTLARQPRTRPTLASDAALGAHTRSAIIRAFAASATPRERALSLMVLSSIGSADSAVVRRGLADVDPAVRREAVVALGTSRDSTFAASLLRAALQDDAAPVRIEALRVLVRRAGASACDAVMTATHDATTVVAVTAVDLAAQRCADHDGLGARLIEMVTTESGGWHRAGHALVALARVNPERARDEVRQRASHAEPFFRMRIAAAAAVLADTALLRTLASDAQANVRTAAVTALTALAPRQYDELLIAALGSDESELLMAAAAALEGTSRTDAAPALAAALTRVSAARRETSRDARVALLHRMRTVPGAAARTDVLRPLLRDFDPVIADSAAAVLSQLTGTAASAAPVPAPVASLPSFAEAERLQRARAEIRLSDGSVITLRLLPFDAPTNAARFARLAAAGYFDGLTFHRVVPNFVVQGGSPGANEYSGDGPFSRDEVGVPNWRGTVGLSTRGRDTGDAQFYVNAVDNIRLDHEYTVFAEVVSGMQRVDEITEGTRIESIRILDN